MILIQRLLSYHSIVATHKTIRPLFITALFSMLAANLNAATNEELAEEARNAADRLVRERIEQKAFEAQIADPSRPVQLPDVEELPEFGQEQVCFVIEDIQVEGLLSNLMRETGAQYINECIGRETITTYIRVLNQQLLAEGYITSRAVLPEQDLSKGILAIEVLAGRIEEIVFPDDYDAIWQHALPMSAGDVLNMRDLEQGIDQLNRLSSQSIELKVEPGSQSGVSKVVAYIKDAKVWNYSLSTDDNGSSSTGKYPLSTSLTLNNMLKIQDVISYSTSLDADTDDTGGSTSESLSLSVPFGYWILDVSLSQFDHYQEIVGDITSFTSSGLGHDEKVTLNHVAFRDNTIKLSWSIGLKKRTRKSFISDTEIDTQRRNLTDLELEGSYRHYLNGKVIDVSIGLNQGVDLFNAQEVDDSASSDEAQPNYRFYSINASLNAPLTLFDKQLNLASQFRLQQADTPLYSLDWFSNGGRYTVRGFSSDESLGAEQGWRLRNDLTIPLTIKSYALSSYIGLDVGGVSGEGSEDIDEKTIMGLTLGAKGKLFGANYDVFMSQPFLLKGPYAEGKCCEAGFSLSYSF